MAWRMGSWTFISVLSSAYLDRVRVSEKALGARKCLHIAGEAREAFAADGLYAEAFHEVRSGKATAHARPAASGKHVIAAAGVVAEGLRGPGTHKHGADRVDCFKDLSGVFGNTQMFGSEAVDEGACGGERRR